MAQKMIGFITRHTYTRAQTEDLNKFLRTRGILKETDHMFAIKQRIKWAASKDREDDAKRNQAIWQKLQKEFDIIVGVFPLVARIVKPKDLQIFSSVSGGTRENIQHLRWEEET